MELLPASWDIIPEILNVLQKHLPQTKTSYSVLKGFSEHRKKFADFKVHFLTPAGKSDPYGTFIIIIPNFRHGVYLDSLNPNIEPFASALSQCPYLDSKDFMRLCTLHYRLWPLIEAFIAKKGLHVVEDDHANAFHISNEDAKNIEVKLPDDVILDCLTVDHAEKVNFAWPHNGGDDSFYEVTQYIRLRPSIGLFKKDTGELVSWCLYLDYGGPGLLQVDENHKRRGYGEATLRAMTKLLGDLGVEPQAFITVHNKNSVALFQKLGYIKGEATRWISVQGRLKN